MSTINRSVALVTAFAGMLSFSAIPVFAEPGLANTPSTQSDSGAPLRPGSLVRVRSGGPLMTVNDIQGDQVNCSWTDWLGELKTQSFPINVLQGPIIPAANQPNVERVE
jgi:uncharacterized protein YodC (DUF2158 family)